MAGDRVGSVIDGRMRVEPGAGLREVINPATGRPVSEQACGDAGLVEEAVASGRRAFLSDGWRRLEPSERGRLLLRVADALERSADRLIDRELADTGKPITQLRTAELPLAATILRFYAGAADKMEGTVKNTADGLRVTVYEPYGVVCGILPWNYPLVNAVMKTAPAIAAGNTIVLKPSVETPLSAVAFAQVCHEAGVPAGIVNVVLGSGSDVGNALVEHPDVAKVSFTGSTQVGCAVLKRAADRMKPVNAECGGKNAILVFADADLARAADATLVSAFVNAGQLCVSCSRLLVEDSVCDEFSRMLAERASRLRVGDPRDERTHIGPMITRSQYDIVLSHIADARREGARVLAGGDRPNVPGELSGGYWITPTLLGDARSGMRAVEEEIFGPVLTIQRFRDEDEAVRMSNASPYGLSGSLWTSDAERSHRVSAALDTGIIWVNTMLVGYPQISVPPRKHSGTGVELGMEGLLAYCRRKSIIHGSDPTTPVGWSLS
ncbi:MAG: aldehyde dehydrogenase [Phycisphaerae bacterium]|nr:aldehyde dehydrogenase [Phycisphaerae bacterium]